MFMLRVRPVSKRFFSSSLAKTSSQPTFDPMQLNPIRNDTNSITNNLKNLSEISNKRKQEQVVLQSNYQLQPKEDAYSARLTGILAGRTVDVYNGNTQNAFKQLGNLMYTNNVPQDKRSQRFYMKPGKVAEMKRSLRHRREFKKGFQRLIGLVKDAKRKGY